MLVMRKAKMAEVRLVVMATILDMSGWIEDSHWNVSIACCAGFEVSKNVHNSRSVAWLIY